MKKFIFFILIILLAAAPVCVLCTGRANAENLFIMGWDGAGYRNVKALLDAGELPNLQAEINKGASLVPLEIHMATVTLPNWTQIFTGLDYDHSKVLGNPHITNCGQMGQFLNAGGWFTPLPFTDTVFDTFKSKGYSVGWFVSKLLLSDDCDWSPLCNIALSADDYLFVYPDEESQYHEILYNQVENFITEYDDYVFFVHTNPDIFGHGYGENSDRYLEEIRRSDTLFGEVMSLLPADTKFIVITDHGFDEGLTTHDNAYDGWMATNLSIDKHYADQSPDRQIAWGTNRDVVPTLYEWLGLDFSVEEPRLRGKSLLE